MIGFVLFSLFTISLQHPTFNRSTYKGLSGVSPRGNTVITGEIKAAYYHDQTVALVDLGPQNQLVDCDVVEVYESYEFEQVLTNLTSVLQPRKVSFKEMINLMKQCNVLEELYYDNSFRNDTKDETKRPSSTVLSGVLPGTKWCGTGDVAENYHDLGQEHQIDRCCRMHDLCPVKIRAGRTRYRIANNAFYTKSHCTCDEIFYQCLKSTGRFTANLMGMIYFNFLKVPCIQETPNNIVNNDGAKREFVSVKMPY